MPAPDPGAWHSLHLHRYAGQDRFLVEHLTPVVAPLRDSGELESFFFLRYWQGGHHIRLRLRPADPDPGRADRLVSDIRDRLAARLAADPAGWGDLDPDEFREAQHTMAALEAETTGDLLPRTPSTPPATNPSTASTAVPRASPSRNASSRAAAPSPSTRCAPSANAPPAGSAPPSP
ncbi:hypothetical protein GCM10020256_30240 [Streptomyces thermocoprophilus]